MKIFFGNIPAGGPQNINVVQATETETAQAITVQKRVNVAQVNGNLIINGTFDTNTDGWTSQVSTLSIETNRLKIENTGGGRGSASQGFNVKAGNVYRWSAQGFRGAGSNDTELAFGTSAFGTDIMYYVTFGNGETKVGYLNCTEDDIWYIHAAVQTTTAGDSCYLDNVEILPIEVAQTITPQLIAGADRIDVTQATETNTSQAVAISKGKAISQVSENETAQAISKTKNISVAQISSSDSAQSLTVFRRKNISVVQVTETDLANAVSKTKTKSITQTSETDSVENISKRKSKSVTQVFETDETSSITSELRVEIVVETNTAQTITSQKIIPIAEATETNEAFSVGVIKQVVITQVTENCSAEEIGRQKRKSICPSSSYEIYCAAVSGATKYIFFLEKKSDNPYHLIEGMDYLSTASNIALSYKIGESASPTFSVTLPDDGIEYTSGIVAETGVGVYSGMRVQLFNTESVPAIETDTVQSISKIKYKAVEQITEVDFADDITPSQPGVVLVFRVNETETALAITSIKIINVSAAEETEFAQGLAQILKRANISFAEESDLAVNISDKPTKYIEIILVSETDKAFVLRRFNPADVNDETLQVNSSVPLSVNIIDGYDVTGVSSDFDISVNIYQDTIEVNYETPYLQEHN